MVATTGDASAELPVRIDATLAEGTVYIPYQVAASAGLVASPTVTIEAV